MTESRLPLWCASNAEIESYRTLRVLLTALDADIDAGHITRRAALKTLAAVSRSRAAARKIEVTMISRALAAYATGLPEGQEVIGA